MYKKKISFGVLFGGIGLIVSTLSGLIIYPLLLKSSSKEIAGLWFFYISFSIIIALGEGGLAPIVMRRAAKAKVDNDPEELNHFLDLIKKSFRIVTLLVSAICFIIYFAYIHWVLLEHPAIFNEGLIAWILFVAGNILTVSNYRNIYIINGFGEVGWDKVVQIIVSIFSIGGYFIALKVGAGLIGLSFVFFLSGVLFSVLSVLLLKKFSPYKVNSSKIKVAKDEITAIFKEGGQVLILNVVAILVLNKDVFLVERFSGLTVLPLFTALNRIQGMVPAVAMLIPSMIYPFIAQSYAEKNYGKTYKLYWQGVIFAMIVAIFICLILIIFADKLVPLWLGDGNYLGNSIFGLMLLFALLIVHHTAHATAIISIGANYFMWPAIINALLSLPFSYIGIKYYGIEGMIIGNIIATFFPSIYVVYYSIRYFAKLKRNENSLVDTPEIKSIVIDSTV
jgi:O-antigen/teichoic acid export membrane protein